MKKKNIWKSSHTLNESIHAKLNRKEATTKMSFDAGDIWRARSPNVHHNFPFLFSSSNSRNSMNSVNNFSLYFCFAVFFLFSETNVDIVLLRSGIVWMITATGSKNQTIFEPNKTVLNENNSNPRSVNIVKINMYCWSVCQTVFFSGLDSERLFVSVHMSRERKVIGKTWRWNKKCFESVM